MCNLSSWNRLGEFLPSLTFTIMSTLCVLAMLRPIPHLRDPTEGLSGAGAVPGSRPGGGWETVFGMLTAMFPSHICVIQPSQSYPEGHRFAFALKFFGCFLINYLPWVIRLNHVRYLLVNKEVCYMKQKLPIFCPYVSSRVEIFSNVTPRFWVGTGWGGGPGRGKC